jgi:hypothetical protein
VIESTVSPYSFVFQEYPATCIHASVPAINGPESGTALASTEREASDANTVQATSDNIETLGDKISIHVGPGEARSNLDSPMIFADDDVIEPGHRDVYTWG